MLIVSTILGIIITLLVVEKWIIQRGVRSLQLRIHVNGTRGKTSVTEYIAAGILNAQPSVMSKVTGVIPTIFYNGEAQILKRQGVARVQEQMKIIRLAARKKVKSLVLECMSVSPELQRLESRLFKPHIYVITNIRDDHREAMGNILELQAESICSAIPGNCKVVTNEIRYLDKIKKSAASNNSVVICPQNPDQEYLSRLPFGIFSENVSLAIAVCEAAGVNPGLAEKGIMNRALDSISPLTTISYQGKEIKFLNAFSVNDVDSTSSFLGKWQKNLGYDGKISIILNTRADRPVRTDLFAEWITGISSAVDHIIITGDHSGRAKYLICKSGITIEKVHCWGRRQLRDVRMNLLGTVPEGSLVIGIGNIYGNGHHIISKLR